MKFLLFLTKTNNPTNDNNDTNLLSRKKNKKLKINKQYLAKHKNINYIAERLKSYFFHVSGEKLIALIIADNFQALRGC